MKRILAAATALLVLTAAPVAADDLSVEVGKTINDWGDCTLVVFDVVGDYNSWLLSHEGQVMASGNDRITQFNLLGTVYGAVGVEREFSTSSGGLLDPGTYTLTVVSDVGTASASVECGDIEFEAALNGWYDEEETITPVEVDDDIVKPKPKPTPKPVKKAEPEVKPFSERFPWRWGLRPI